MRCSGRLAEGRSQGGVRAQPALYTARMAGHTAPTPPPSLLDTGLAGHPRIRQATCRVQTLNRPPAARAPCSAPALRTFGMGVECAAVCGGKRRPLRDATATKATKATTATTAIYRPAP